ncbi:zinc-ribbon domain-containing protein [Sulfitobacter sp. HNIBRBA3233]|uniref:zinc-ribbon domain-containing protein n=1 Tax=Sulfitobacter marinivivus TaxID=3158558 RepID=UPI0032DEBE3D
MRLICPNCDAQYEVPDDVMPATGRDVQCSNCGQTWFQHHPDHAPAELPQDDPVTADDEEVAPPPPPPPPAPEPKRKQLDPAVADILRQEAEAEQAARRAGQSGGGLESQPDLGLDAEPQPRKEEADRRAREARERMARMRGEDPDELAVEDAEASAAGLRSRRDMLPDIEEINSTLRAGASGGNDAAQEDAPRIDAPTHQRKRRGFRTGFLTVVLIFIVLSAIYILAPRLATSVPALAPPLAAYTSAVDRGRIWIDTQIRGVLEGSGAEGAGGS